MPSANNGGEAGAVRDALARELKDVRKQIAAFETELREKPESGLGKGDMGIARWEMVRELLRQLRQQAVRLERVSSHSEGSPYGLCVRCGQPIHPDRLAVLPGAVLCIRCARDRGGQVDGQDSLAA